MMLLVSDVFTSFVDLFFSTSFLEFMIDVVHLLLLVYCCFLSTKYGHNFSGLLISICVLVRFDLPIMIYLVTYLHKSSS